MILGWCLCFGWILPWRFRFCCCFVLFPYLVFLYFMLKSPVSIISPFCYRSMTCAVSCANFALGWYVPVCHSRAQRRWLGCSLYPGGWVFLFWFLFLALPWWVGWGFQTVVVPASVLSCRGWSVPGRRSLPFTVVGLLAMVGGGRLRLCRSGWVGILPS